MLGRRAGLATERLNYLAGFGRELKHALVHPKPGGNTFRAPDSKCHLGELALDIAAWR